MSITSRPSVGTWSLNNKTVVRSAPDCVVYINGFTEFGSCPTCKQKLDFQKYITSVSCDVSKEPITSASISMKIPRHAKEVFNNDGTLIFKPGLEVIILMKGYFPTKNYAGLGFGTVDDFDADDVSVYPYYQCFRGVVTSVSYDHETSITLSCSNLLHFWQHLKVATNGAAFGPKPASSAVNVELSGHSFTGMNPYSIIYTLVEAGFGAAFGVDFVYSQSTNIKAKDDSTGEYAYTHAAEWWEKRWQERSGNLRMYGMDGRMFTGNQQTYLGRWSRGDKTFTKEVKTVLEAAKSKTDIKLRGASKTQARLRELGYDQMATSAGVYSKQNRKGSVITQDVLKMHAFMYDITAQGSVNMFETEYASKLDIVNQVLEITGFEFYQDADGDFVFKPPMYNLDTRQDPVYVIKDRDLISIEESREEPAATLIRGTGSHWANVGGHGVDGWAGVGGVFIDYRLVAQYGYREESFDTKYFSSRQAIFLSCINRLDLANIGVTSGSISIPLRPELKPGYPVYVERTQSYYYVESVSHSFSYGGEATTSISWVAKRSKWYPPVKSTNEGKLTSMDDVKLDSPDEYPQHPVIAYPKDPFSDSPPRMLGFPNVVMALDVQKLNYDTVDVETNLLKPDQYLELLLKSGKVHRKSNDKNSFIIPTGQNQEKVFTLEEFTTTYTVVSEAEFNRVPDTINQDLGYIIQQFYQQYEHTLDVESGRQLVNFLAVQNSTRSSFAPGTSLAGRYRYYSCSHPDPKHQAPYTLLIDQEEQTITDTVDAGVCKDSALNTVFQFQDREDGLGVVGKTVPVTEVRGLKAVVLTSKKGGNETRIISTADVHYITFGPHEIRKKVRISKINPNKTTASNFKINVRDIKRVMSSDLYLHAANFPTDDFLEDVFIDKATTFDSAIDTFKDRLQIEETTKIQNAYFNYVDVFDTLYSLGSIQELGTPATETLRKLSGKLSNALGDWLNQIVAAGYKKLRKSMRSKAQESLYTDYMTYRQELFNSMFGAGTLEDPLQGVSYVYVEETKKQLTYTPIFPVTDGSGYEVIGTLPYGRGLTIDTYAKLFQSEKGELETTIVGQGINTTNMESVARFQILFASTGDAEQSLILLDEIDEEQNKYNVNSHKAVLAAYNVGTEEQLTEVLESLDAGEDISPKLRIRNIPVTSYFRGQRTTGQVGSLQLADLDFDEGICACRGADGAFYLQAFNQQNYLVQGKNAITSFQQELAQQQTQGWVNTKETLAGTNLENFQENTPQQDPYTLLTGTVNTITSNVNSINTDIGNLVQDIDNLFDGEDDG